MEERIRKELAGILQSHWADFWVRDGGDFACVGLLLGLNGICCLYGENRMWMFLL